ncbi:MAG: hypothetical protein QM747_10040 [Nocardioides sp.]
MWVIVVFVVVVAALVVWFLRSPSFRARRSGRDSGQRGGHDNPYGGDGGPGGVF